MAVSSLKGCWYKFSARIRDYLDVVDSYYRPADDLDGQQLSRTVTNCLSGAGDHHHHHIIGDTNSKRHPANGCHKPGGHHHHHLQPKHHRHHHNCPVIDASSARNQISPNGVGSQQLPPGYTKRKTSQGQVYFVDRFGHKYWYDPSVPKELLSASLDLDSLIGTLSSTWEVRQTSSGKTYYVNHIKKTTQFTDPRLVAYKDHLMSIIKHIKSTTTNSSNNINQTITIATNHQNTPPIISGGGSQNATSQRNNHSSRAAARSSPSSNQAPSQSKANSNTNSITRNTCSLHNSHSQSRNNNGRNHPDSDNLRRHLFAALEEARNSHNQYQLNLLSGSHHNLSTNHSNTLNGPLPGWIPPSMVNLAGAPTSRKQLSSNGTNSNDTAPASSTMVASDVHNHTTRSMTRSGSISNLFPLSANNTNNNNMASLDRSIPTHPTRSNKELFDKISILRQELLKQQVIAHPCRIDINRKRIFEESFRVVSQVQPRDLKKRLLVKFRGEEGLDYGGVAREWFYLLSREILNPVHGLFQYTSDDIYNLQINPDSGIVYREHLSYMNFCGRIIGMAVFHGHFIEGHFTLPFYKMLLRKSINLGDIELVDPELYRSLCWILENDITNVIDTTFLVQHNAFGELQEHELKENGRNIVVTEENKHEYVSLYVNYRCRRGIAGQFEALQRGFYELISPSLLENFDEHELELLIGGLSKINIEDWRLHTKLKNCTVETPLVRWFWELVKSYSEDKRARLLQFVTGSPRVPIQGFKALQGVNSELRLFTIHLIKNACTDNLPKSHTCFNRIDLPPYENYEKLRDKLTQAIEETMGFAMQ